MLWSKLIFISERKFQKWEFFIVMTEICVENIPQFFIQIINNNKSG